MAIPDADLELNIDYDELTVGDVELLTIDYDNDFDYIRGMRDFLLEYCTSWSPTEIRGLKIHELQAVWVMIRERWEKDVLGEVDSPDSQSGRPATQDME